MQSFGLLFMMFNTKAEPFDDVRVRQALHYALDMDKIIETGMLGNATPATSFLPEDYPNYHEASTVYSYDPEKAEELLEEAGVSDLAITLRMTDTGWVKEVAPLIKESLDAIGIDTTLDISQSASMYEKVDSGDYTVAIAPGDPSVFGVDPDLLMNWWYGENVWTQTRTAWADSPEYAELRTLLDTAVTQEGEEQQESWEPGVRPDLRPGRAVPAVPPQAAHRLELAGAGRLPAGAHDRTVVPRRRRGREVAPARQCGGALARRARPRHPTPGRSGTCPTRSASSAGDCCSCR
ncbi:hypothetical protein CTI14_27205 [Methylobacterium radiotolerans]|nr:hypothetical protein CTI14_27205 [Methylobacterium radiotolerans]